LDNSPADLQQRLELISEYCSKWGLHVNAVKSKILGFRKNGLVLDPMKSCNIMDTAYNTYQVLITLGLYLITL